MNLHAKDNGKYPIAFLCELLGVKKQAYYKRDLNALADKAILEEIAVQYIKDIRRKDPGMGGSKIWYMYHNNCPGIKSLGRDHFLCLIDKYGLKVRQRVRKPRTTDSTHGLTTYPNLIKDFIPDGPNQLWVSDITYITVWDDKYHSHYCYLSLILDAYTEEIVGWYVGRDLSAEYPLRALEMALQRLEGIPLEERNLIHHSDRGCQYASQRYVGILNGNGIRISMTECGDPKDNAQAERINNTMKNELLKGLKFFSVSSVIYAVAEAVSFYNNERPHMSINMMTPHEAASYEGEIQKKWVSYRENHIKNKQKTCSEANDVIYLPHQDGYIQHQGNL